MKSQLFRGTIYYIIVLKDIKTQHSLIASFIYICVSIYLCLYLLYVHILSFFLRKVMAIGESFFIHFHFIVTKQLNEFKAYLVTQTISVSEGS